MDAEAWRAVVNELLPENVRFHRDDGGWWRDLSTPPTDGSLLALMAARIAEQAETIATLRAILAAVPAPEDE
jgi:hypothetical protein